MKIIGQSTLADGAPYIHLGYTSATTWNGATPRVALLGGGILLLGLGALAAQTAARPGLGRRRRLALIMSAAMIFGCAAVAMTVAALPGMWGAREVHAHPERVSRQSAELVVEFLQERKTRGLPLPAEMAEAKSMGLPSSTDGWKREMRLVREGDSYVITSAGEDGAFGTPDDIQLTAKFSPSQPATTQSAASR